MKLFTEDDFHYLKARLEAEEGESMDAEDEEALRTIMDSFEVEIQ